VILFLLYFALGSSDRKDKLQNCLVLGIILCCDSGSIASPQAIGIQVAFEITPWSASIRQTGGLNVFAARQVRNVVPTNWVDSSPL